MELPTINKTIFRRQERQESVERTRVILQRFLEAILSHDIVSSSELVYAFFSPSPERLKCVPEREDNRFKKLKALFKNSDQTKKGKDDLSSNESHSMLMMDEFSDTEKSFEVKDDIAEPFYALISEVFDLRGVFKWFRKSLVTFVQMSLGGTISRQLQDWASLLVSEASLVTALNMLKNSFWSNGQLRPAAPPRTEAEKEQSRLEAEQLFLSSPPDMMVRVVGLQTAVRGMEKVFRSCQNKTLNKHLVYTLLECLVREIIPELQDTRVKMQLKPFSKRDNGK